MVNSIALTDEAIFKEIFKHINSDMTYLPGIDNIDDIMEMFAIKYMNLLESDKNPYIMEILKRAYPEKFI